MGRRILRRLGCLGRAFLKVAGVILVLVLAQLLVQATAITRADDTGPTGARAAELVVQGFDRWSARERQTGGEWWYEGVDAFCTRQGATLWYDCRYAYTLVDADGSRPPADQVDASTYYCDREGCIVAKQLIR